MFDDIRPFRDSEAPAIVKNLINEPALQASIASYVIPRIYAMAPSLSSTLVKHFLKWRLKRINSVEEFQTEVAKYLHRLIKNGAIFKIYVQINQKHPFITKCAGSAEPLSERALRFNDVTLPA